VQIIVERDVLADGVAWAARALPRNPAVPVLEGIRLVVGSDLKVTVSAFDYDVSAQATVPVTAQRLGSALVPGRLLASITEKLPAKPVQITVEDGRLILTCGTGTFTLPTLPEDEYPALPAMPTATGTAGSDAFATAVGQAAVAASHDDTLPALTAVRIELADDTLTLVATDRYRLAISRLPWTPGRPGLTGALLVPARSLSGTARVLTSAAEVSIAVGDPGGDTPDGMIGFEGAGLRSTARLLGGEFPQVQNLLPKTANASAQLPVAALAEAVRRVALVAEHNTPVRLAFSEGQLLLSAGDGDEAKAEEAIDAGFDGDALTIGFNPRYLLDGLGVLASDTVRMSFTEPGKPALITGGDEPADAEPSFRYVLMPIRSGG
jgi:DNA polymerase III subunit beta